MADKFEDCSECLNRNSEFCEECDYGEHFEEDEDGLDLNDLGRAA